jgi:hypothetical protein
MRLKTKVAAGLWACFFGWMGAHWWYLGRRHAWTITLLAAVCLGLAARYPVWYDNPFFFVLFIPMVEGFIEGVVLCLIADEKFGRYFNPGSSQPQATGWGPVLVAILNTLVGAVLSMFAIAMVVLHVYVALGWLDGITL